MKHKFLAGLMVILVIGLLLASCAQEPATPAPAPAPEPIKMRYSGGLPPTHHMSVDQKWFVDEVTKRTGGLVTVDAYIGAELYKHTECVDAVSAGAIELGFASLGNWSGRNPVLGFYNYFLLFPSRDQFERSKDKIAPLLSPLYEEQNVKFLHWFAYGDMGYIGTKPVVNPEDIKGLVIRGMNQATLAALEELGAVPAAISAAEVYDALSKGAIDGALSGWSSFNSRKFYEVTDYCSGPFFTSPWQAFMNLDTWNKLTPDIQKTVMEVAKETEARSFEHGRDYDKTCLELLEKEVTLTILSKEQEAAWLEFVSPTWDAWLADCDKAGYGSQARELMKIIDETR
ncbi:TRAP transporter substrate-binding protein [Chloroflexota bacterium]